MLDKLKERLLSIKSTIVDIFKKYGKYIIVVTVVVGLISTVTLCTNSILKGIGVLIIGMMVILLLMVGIMYIITTRPTKQ